MKFNVRLLVRVLAAVIFILGASVWFLGGAHPGWTKTSVAVEVADEITGIVGRTYEDRLVPGVEFPAVGVLAAIGLIGISFLLPAKKRAT